MNPIICAPGIDTAHSAMIFLRLGPALARGGRGDRAMAAESDVLE
jgi:hypothetical protein